MNGERGKGAVILATLQSRIADSTYRPGFHLPPQRALAEEFAVSREMIVRVLEVLKGEGWIESRQGSGSRAVVTPPIHVASALRVPQTRVALGPFIARAFAQAVVALDVFTLASESLDPQFWVQVEAIFSGALNAPESITLRLLLPSASTKLPYPRAIRSAERAVGNGELDRLLQDRLRKITRRHTSSLCDALRDLMTDRLVAQVDV